MFNIYVYYRVDPQHSASAEAPIRAMQAQLASRTGVAPQLLKKRDEPLLWMETYQDVDDADAFLSELTRVADEYGLGGFRQGEPHVECFFADTAAGPLQSRPHNEPAR